MPEGANTSPPTIHPRLGGTDLSLPETPDAVTQILLRDLEGQVSMAMHLNRHGVIEVSVADLNRLLKLIRSMEHQREVVRVKVAEVKGEMRLLSQTIKRFVKSEQPS